MSSVLTNALLDPNKGSINRRKDVTVMDTTSTSLHSPSISLPVVDGVTLGLGDTVLYTALTHGANAVYTLHRDTSTGTPVYSFPVAGTAGYTSDARSANGQPTAFDVVRVQKGTSADNVLMWSGDAWETTEIADVSDTVASADVYIPTTPSNWNPAPATIGAALDQNAPGAPMSKDLDLSTHSIVTSTTNQNIRLQPNGSGALVAESSSLSGNSRGQNVVDLQLSRADSGHIANSDFSTITGGDTHFIYSGNYGVVSGGQANGVLSPWSFVGAGNSNIIGGGGDQSAYTVIAGGQSNFSNSGWSTISGGLSNLIFSSYGFIGSGLNNIITSDSISFDGMSGAVLVGGLNNFVGAGGGFLGGGGNNTITANAQQVGPTPGYATLVGGQNNTVAIAFATLVGGSNNFLDAGFSFLGGGENNNLNGDAWQVLVGGQNNLSSGDHNFLGGGHNNIALGAFSVLGAGNNNQIISSNPGIVVGGSSNLVSGSNASILGGTNNTATGNGAMIVGGDNVFVSGNSTLGSGDTVWGSNTQAAVFGGNNWSAHTNTLVAGGGALTSANYDFVLGNTSNQGVPGVPAATIDAVHLRMAGDTSSLHIGRSTNQPAVSPTASYTVSAGQNNNITTSGTLPTAGQTVLFNTPVSGLTSQPVVVVFSNGTFVTQNQPILNNSQVTLATTDILPIGVVPGTKYYTVNATSDAYTFILSAPASIAHGTVYTNNGSSFRVVVDTNSSTTLITRALGGAPNPNGTLVYLSGDSPGDLTYTAENLGGRCQLALTPGGSAIQPSSSRSDGSDAGPHTITVSGINANQKYFVAASPAPSGSTFSVAYIATGPAIPTYNSGSGTTLTTLSYYNASAQHKLHLHTTNPNNQSLSTSLKASPSLTAQVDITLPGSAGTSGQVLSTDGTGVTSWVNPASNIMTLDSNPSVGGASSEALTVTGLLTTDSVLSVSQKTSGANNTAMTSYGSPGTGTLTVGWTADPGAGAVARVLIKR